MEKRSRIVSPPAIWIYFGYVGFAGLVGKAGQRGQGRLSNYK
jgi:hypothetical protein